LDLANWKPVEEAVPSEVMELVEKRQQARQIRNWAEADALRAKVGELGYEIEDTPQGPKVKRKKR